MPRLAPVVVDFGSLAESYLLACRAEGKSPYTVSWYAQKLRAFTGWLQAHERVGRVADVSPEHVRRFIDHLRTSVEPWADNPFVPTHPGGRLSPYTVKGYAQVIKGFYAWLEREGQLDRHPVAKLRMPKVPKKLVTPLDPDQIGRLLAGPDPRTVTGIRDRAILSVLIDCGLRVSELCGLGLGAMHQSTGTLKVFGKGGKERIVPHGTATGKAIARWLQVRSALLDGEDDPNGLFLSQYGVPLTRHAVELLVRDHAGRAGLGVRCYPHLLRHTFAVSFLRAGGDAFSLQRLLGHTTLETVKLYVNLAEQDIITAYRRASPLDHLTVTKGRKPV